MKRLPIRSKSAIEMKHQNISAVLMSLQFPYISGYKPLPNYQHALLDAVISYLNHHRESVEGLLEQTKREVQPQEIPFEALLSAMEPPPEPKGMPLLELEAQNQWLRSPIARQVDFVAIEENNRSLGEAGEKFVMQYEHARLSHAGCKLLAERVEQVSKTRGDGLGYDILSWETTGKERFIEVKSTSSGIYTPFYLTARELNCSTQWEDRYFLYRVYHMRSRPRMYSLQGNLSERCHLTPTQYRASSWHPR